MPTIARPSVLARTGTVVEADTVTAALDAAHLNWEVTKEQLRHPVTNELGNSYATMRSDNQFILKWGISNLYNIIQNRFAFNLVDDMVRTMDCRISSAGEWRLGRRIWLNVETPMKIEPVPGDVIQLKLLLENAHDASMGQRCTIFPERLLSGTGLVAENWSMMRSFSWRHSAGVENRLQNAAAIFARMANSFNVIGQTYTSLAHQQLSDVQAEQYVKYIYPLPEDQGEEDTNGIHRMSVLELFRSNNDEQLESIRGTKYSMFNSVAKYVDHIQRHRGKAENHARSVVVGKALKFKFLALNTLVRDI